MTPEKMPELPPEEEKTVWEKIEKGFTSFVEWFLFLALLLMVLLVFINVVGRFFFHTGITASEEIAKFLLVWITFMGSIYCFQKNEHIIVDILVGNLPRKARKVVNIIANVILSVTLVLAAYYCFKFIMINVGFLTPLTKIPLPIIQSILPISMAAMFLMNIGKLMKLIKS